MRSTLFSVAALPLAAHALDNNNFYEGPGVVRFPLTGNKDALERHMRRQFEAGLDNRKTGFFYTIDLQIGTPPQTVAVNFDTGSSELWVNPNCAKSNDEAYCKTFGAFGQSSSFVSLKQNITLKYGRGHADIEYGYDYVTVGTSKINQQTFGVAHDSEFATTGIMGVGPNLRGWDSPYPYVLDNLFTQKFINSRAFSLDLRQVTSPRGAAVFGGIDTKKFKGPLVKKDIIPAASAPDGKIRYWANCDGIIINREDGTKVTVLSQPQAFLFDSGYTISSLPTALFTELLKAFPSAVKEASGQYVVDCGVVNLKGTLDFKFGNATISVPYSEFIWQQPDYNSCVLGAIEDNVMPVLGDTFLRAAYVVYDWDNRALHFAAADDCGSNLVAIGSGPGAVGVTEGECAQPTSTSSSTSSVATSTTTSTTSESTSTTTTSSIPTSTTTSTTSESTSTTTTSSIPTSTAASTPSDSTSTTTSTTSESTSTTTTSSIPTSTTTSTTSESTSTTTTSSIPTSTAASTPSDSTSTTTSTSTASDSTSTATSTSTASDSTSTATSTLTASDSTSTTTPTSTASDSTSTATSTSTASDSTSTATSTLTASDSTSTTTPTSTASDSTSTATSTSTASDSTSTATSTSTASDSTSTTTPTSTASGSTLTTTSTTSDSASTTTSAPTSSTTSSIDTSSSTSSVTTVSPTTSAATTLTSSTVSTASSTSGVGSSSVGSSSVATSSVGSSSVATSSDATSTPSSSVTTSTDFPTLTLTSSAGPISSSSGVSTDYPATTGPQSNGSLTTGTPIKNATTYTSIVKSTRTHTITSCAPTVTNCPVGKVTTEVITSYTTWCPEDNKTKPASPSTVVSTSTASPSTVASTASTSAYTKPPCPEVTLTFVIPETHYCTKGEAGCTEGEAIVTSHPVTVVPITPLATPTPIPGCVDCHPKQPSKPAETPAAPAGVVPVAVNPHPVETKEQVPAQSTTTLVVPAQPPTTPAPTKPVQLSTLVSAKPSGTGAPAPSQPPIAAGAVGLYVPGLAALVAALVAVM